jgi:hypothetical protein
MRKGESLMGNSDEKGGHDEEIISVWGKVLPEFVVGREVRLVNGFEDQVGRISEVSTISCGCTYVVISAGDDEGGESIKVLVELGSKCRSDRMRFCSRPSAPKWEVKFVEGGV